MPAARQRVAMNQEKRKGPRRPLRYTAWISLPSEKLHGCVINDISDFGAKLDVENAEGVPEKFLLLLSARGTPKRKCRVVWRDGEQIGVEFERPLAQADKSRPILKAEQMTPPATLPPDDSDTVDIEAQTAEPA